MKNKMRNVFIVSCFAVFAVASNSSALIITDSITVNNGGLNYNAGESGTFELDQFDSSLGTLNSVLVEVTGNSFGGFSSLDNESNTTGGNVDVEIGTEITVSGPAAVTVITLPIETAAATLSTDDEPGAAADFVGTDSVSVFGTSSSDSDSDTPGSFVSYIGTGSVTFNFIGAGQTGFNIQTPLTITDFFGFEEPGDSLGIDSAPGQFNFLASVTYDYTPFGPASVPEPGTMGLLASIGILAEVGRRRKKRAKATQV